MGKVIKEFSSPPLIFNFHSDEYRTVETEEELKEFENMMRNGARIRDFDFSKENLISIATTSCSGGCADDCDVVQ